MEIPPQGWEPLAGSLEKLPKRGRGLLVSKKFTNGS